MPAPVYVFTDDPQNFQISYSDNGDPAKKAALEAKWQKFNRYDPATRQTYKILSRPSSYTMGAAADYVMPASAPAGRYRVETFVPGVHATARKAIFNISYGFRRVGNGTENENRLAIVDLNELRDVWYPLGEFELNPARDPNSGRVRQFDVSMEDPPGEISFGPVRWAPILARPANSLRYDSPVGAESERAGPLPSGTVLFGRYPVWAGQWFDVNPFLNWYAQGCHTGADLNLPGVSSADKGKPIYAVAEGTVIYAGRAGTWGNIVVLEHPDALVSLPGGQSQRQVVYSRYGHVDDNILVRNGQTVRRGQNIAFIGLPYGSTAGWHLHFDVCYTDLLRRRPSSWPNLTTIQALQSSGVRRDSREYQAAQAAVVKEVISHYVDPIKFLQENHR